MWAITYLAGLCQAHAHSEAGRHAWGEGGGQRAAQAWIYNPDTSDHRLHDQLTAELLDAADLLTEISVNNKSKCCNCHSHRQVLTCNGSS